MLRISLGARFCGMLGGRPRCVAVCPRSACCRSIAVRNNRQTVTVKLSGGPAGSLICTDRMQRGSSRTWPALSYYLPANTARRCSGTGGQSLKKTINCHFSGERGDRARLCTGKSTPHCFFGMELLRLLLPSILNASQTVVNNGKTGRDWLEIATFFSSSCIVIASTRALSIGTKGTMPRKRVLRGCFSTYHLRRVCDRCRPRLAPNCVTVDVAAIDAVSFTYHGSTHTYTLSRGCRMATASPRECAKIVL